MPIICLFPSGSGVIFITRVPPCIKSISPITIFTLKGIAVVTKVPVPEVRPGNIPTGGIDKSLVELSAGNDLPFNPTVRNLDKDDAVGLSIIVVGFSFSHPPPQAAITRAVKYPLQFAD